MNNNFRIIFIKINIIKINIFKVYNKNTDFITKICDIIRIFLDFLTLKEPLVAISVKRLHSLPESMYLKQATTFKICQRNLNFFGRTPPFLL